MAIHRLSQETVEKIAAGEVIESPSDVVKELVENSIDSFCQRIIIEVRGGFTKLEGYIRVIDDGVGVSKNDFSYLFERHSTSKIKVIDDLIRLTSLGFRGEALSSIASVSRVEFASRAKDEEVGYKIICDNGVKDKVRTVSMREGTLVNVSDIFKYLPARLKFLKPDRVELNNILRYVIHTALFHTNLDFELVINNNGVFSSPGTGGDLRRRLFDVFEFDIAEKMIKTQIDDGEINIDGYISTPDINRADSKSIYIAVNKKPITDKDVLFSIINAYKGLLPAKRYPIVVLNITVPPDVYDVNVHPRKSEVRFKEPRRISGLVYKAISKTLGSMTIIYPSYIERPDVSIINKNTYVSRGNFIKREEIQLRKQIQEEGVLESLIEGGESKYSFIGCLGEKYIVLKSQNEFYIIDQHSSAEAILYYKLMEIFKSASESKSQFLLVPKAIYLTGQREALLSYIKKDLEVLGYSFDDFGEKFLLIRAIPAILQKHDEVRLLEDVLDGLEVDDVREKSFNCVLSEIACHRSLRSDNRITPAEAVKLLEEIISLPEEMRRCPHGRRLIMILSMNELDRFFGRKL